MWYCERRQYIGRGPDVTHRRESMETFILAHGLRLANVENQPVTFAGPSGSSNIDLTLTKGTPVTGWRMHENKIDSDHRLITFVVAKKTENGVDSSAGSPDKLMRLRDRGVDWAHFEDQIRLRMGAMKWNRSATRIGAQFTKALKSTALQTLGLKREGNNERGYEWWTPELDRMRRDAYRLRRAWQTARRRESLDEEAAKQRFHVTTRSYRVAMKEAQLLHFQNIANPGNLNS
ncbi:unnamed protein product [Euphydryas editha]|uniref:Endonuclease/exonuclease/phosphatase domain-containing protein n=1 Tax=Euphydryas editha TaxID=104508 RepID=A0AAU9T984_EUPED|nr:unnamed protein product [Euphydryas editha]